MRRRRIVVGIAAVLLLAIGAWWAAGSRAITPVAPTLVADARPALPPASARLREHARAPVPALPVPAARPERPVARCVLPTAAADATVVRVRGLPWSKKVRRRAHVEDGAIVVPLPSRGAGAEPVDATAELAGVGTLPLTLAPDGGGWSCTTGDVVRYAAVTGRVLTTEGIADDRILVTGCGQRTRVDADGGFFLEVPPGPCTLRATRVDGAFAVRSVPIDVRPGSGDEIVLDLGLPAWRAAGVGTQIARHPDGVRVGHVFDDTPASDAGLREGDVVVALDGEDVAGIDPEGFVDLALGPAGTEVTYTVVRGGEELDVVMRREELDPPPRE